MSVAGWECPHQLSHSTGRLRLLQRGGRIPLIPPRSLITQTRGMTSIISRHQPARQDEETHGVQPCCVFCAQITNSVIPLHAQISEPVLGSASNSGKRRCVGERADGLAYRWTNLRRRSKPREDMAVLGAQSARFRFRGWRGIPGEPHSFLSGARQTARFLHLSRRRSLTVQDFSTDEPPFVLVSREPGDGGSFYQPHVVHG